MGLFRSLFILFLATGFRALAQTNTPNIGFEQGSFDHWQCYISHIDRAGVINVNPSAPTFDRQTLYGKESAGAVDPYGKFPVLCPNGSNYSMKVRQQGYKFGGRACYLYFYSTSRQSIQHNF